MVNKLWFRSWKGITDLKTLQNALSLTYTKGWDREELVLAALMMGAVEL